MKKFFLLIFLTLSILIIFATDYNINNWQLKQYNSSKTYTFGDTVVPGGYFIIICRGKNKTDFETYYGITLPSNVIFIDSAGTLPQLNGSETFSLYDSLNQKIDTTYMSLTTGRIYYRDSTNTNTFSYTSFSTSNATPGSIGSTVYNRNKGLVITEVVDASSYLYEYVEIYNDTGVYVNLPPSILNLKHEPAVPFEEDNVLVTCKITDDSTVSSDTLFFKINGGSWDKIQKTSISPDSIYTYTLGQFNYNDTLSFFVKATDNLNAISYSETLTVVIKQKTTQTFNLKGWQLKQYNSSYTYTFNDLSVPGGYTVILCRGKNKTDFETHYGITLPSNVIFIDSVGTLPQLNGSETFSLYDSLNQKIDTTYMSLTTGRIYYRDSTNTNTFSYTSFSTSNATPGTVPTTQINNGRGIIITEVVDNTSNYLYEYIELYNDTIGIKQTTIKNVVRNPIIPYSNQSDTIIANIQHYCPLKKVLLIASSYDSSYIDTYNMVNISSDTLYRYILNPRGDGCRFEFYVEVVDSLDRITRSTPQKFFWGITPIPSYKVNDTLGSPKYLDYQVRTTGVVTVSTGAFNTFSNIINLQQNYILGTVWKNDSIISEESVIEGDSVIVEGTIGFYRGQTRIQNPYSKLTKISAGHFIDTILLTADNLRDTIGETYDALLLKINAKTRIGGTWPATNQNSLLVFKDTVITKNNTKAIDTFLVWIDSDTDIDGTVEPTWPKQIIGILTQYDTLAPYWSTYEVYPRSFNDLSSTISLNESSITATLLKDGVLIRWNYTGNDKINMIRIQRKYEDEDFYKIIAELKPEERSFKDKLLSNKRREYTVIGITVDGKTLQIGKVSITPKTSIKTFKFSINYNLTSKIINFDIENPETQKINLNLYNFTGTLVKNLFSGIIEKGYTRLSIKLNKLPSGIYFVKEKDHKEFYKFEIVK